MRQPRLARVLIALAVVLSGALALAAYAAPASQAPQQSTLPARVAVVHAAPFAAGNAAVAVTAQFVVGGQPVGGELVITSSFRFKDVIPYLTLPAGAYRIKLYPASATVPGPGFVYDEVITVEGGKDYTALAVGGANSQPLDIVAYEDVVGALGSTDAKLRVIHAAPFNANPALTAVSVIPDGDTNEDNNLIPVASRPFIYGTATAFLTVPSGTPLDYKVVPAGSPGTTAIDLPPLTLNAGNVVSVIAVGDGVNQDLSFVALPAPPVAPARVRLVHAAPFATGNATVTVRLNGQIVTNSFDFRDITPYTTLPAGIYTAEVFVGTAATGTPALTAPVVLQDGQSYTVVAMGSNVAPFPLKLRQLTDDSSSPGAGVRLRVLHAAPFAATIPATAVDVALQNGTVVGGLDNIVYDDLRAIALSAGAALDLKVVPAGQPNATPIIDPGLLTLPDGSAFTVIAVGGPNGQAAGLLLLDDLSVTQSTYLPLTRKP